MAEDMFPKPSVGRAVHFNSSDLCWAATVTAVNHDGTVCLTVQPPMGHSFNLDNVPEGQTHNTWHWPERV